MVRELEAETTIDTRIVLEATGGGGRLEAGLSEAASLARHLLRSGSSVEVLGPGIHVHLGRGRSHEQRLLTALALYERTRAVAPAAGAPSAPTVREVRIGI
jgi:uncharacterized protein (DUF58 family)